MEQKNKQRQSLKQKFLPYLVMKAKIFELPNTELNEFINDLIESNPFVDEGDFVTYEERRADYELSCFVASPGK